MSARPAVFLDRDGVVNALAPDPESGTPESPLCLEDVHLLEGVIGAIHRLRDEGYLVVCVTNQPAAAKMKASVETLDAIHAAIRERLQAESADFDASEICLHHPDGVVVELTRACDCRKPAPGMLLRAAERLDIDLGRSWMIGDSDSDIEAGQAAGCSTILVEHPPSSHRRAGRVRPLGAVRDLHEAVQLLLANDRRCYHRASR